MLSNGSFPSAVLRVLRELHHTGSPSGQGRRVASLLRGSEYVSSQEVGAGLA